MIHTDRLLWLAEREIECPHLGAMPGDTWYEEWVAPSGCKFCKGTGKVPHFPTLRKKCSSCYWAGTCLPICLCQGRGWIPVDALEATLLCAYEWRFKQLGQNDILAYCRLTQISLDKSEHGPTYNEAAILVLYNQEKKP